MEDAAVVFFVILRQHHTNKRFFLKSTFIRYLYSYFNAPVLRVKYFVP
jgi:hypothetical protein